MSITQNIASTQFLHGEILIKPLVSYHGFFIDKIENSDGLKNVAWRITHIISGLILYPVTGIFAGIGTLISYIDLRILNSSTASEIKELLEKLDKNNCSAVLNTFTCYNVTSTEEFSITLENKELMLKEIIKKIQTFTSQFQRVYLGFDLISPAKTVTLMTVNGFLPIKP